MSLDFYVAAFLPALLWGFSPIITKRALSNGGNFFQASVVVVSLCSVIYWVILILLQGLAIFETLNTRTVLIFMIGGMVGTTLGRLCAFIGVNQVGASVTSAAISIRPLFSGILAVGFLKETLDVQLTAGIVLVVCGLIVLARTRGGDLRGWKATDLLFPLGAAFAFGLGNVIRRYGMITSSVHALEAVALNEAGAWLSLMILGPFLKFRERLQASVVSYGLLSLTGLMTAMALYSMFYALQRGPVVIVDPLTSTAPLFTAFFSYLFLKDLERVTWDVVLGACVVCLGVILITLS